MTKRIHVGIDARCLNTDHIRGMGRYVAEVVSRLSGSGEFSWTLYGDRKDFALHMPNGECIQADVFEMKGYRWKVWEQIGLPIKAMRSEVDVLHCTASTGPWWQPVPTVLTLHDTLYWEENGARLHGNGLYMDYLVPSAINKCRAVITISEQSRKDILRLWPRLESKLHVIPHGVSDSYLVDGSLPLSARLREKLGGRRYMLYLGGSANRKRFEWAVSVLGQIKSKELILMACGFSLEDIQKQLNKLSDDVKRRIVFLPFVEEGDMPGLYRNAVCVLYPTLYEGFGFPVVESQAVGTPILFSPVGSLSELRGPGAEVIPANDLGAWVSVVDKLTVQRIEGGRQNEEARAWAQKFSWRKSARKHAEIYKECRSAE